ncbi:MAG: LysR family transcriptional regulator [Lautropia sp.]
MTAAPHAGAQEPLERFLLGGLKTRHMALLIALDEERRMGKVAARTHVTQSAVSKALAELESALGLPLFERSPRGLEPTAYGECLIRHLREWQRGLDTAREELRGLALGLAGRIHVGVLPAAAAVLLPRGLVAMKSRLPETSVVVREGPLDLLVSELRRGRIDLIVGTLMPRQVQHDLEETVLADVAPTLVVRKGHPLLRRRRPSWTDLAALPWVLPHPGSLMRQPLEEMLQRAGVPLPRSVIETVSVQVIGAYVAATQAVAVVPRDVARHYSALGLTRSLPLELPPLIRPQGVIRSRTRPVLPAARVLMECLREIAVGELA